MHTPGIGLGTTWLVFVHPSYKTRRKQAYDQHYRFFCQLSNLTDLTLHALQPRNPPPARLFLNFLTLIPAFLVLGANAAAIPTPVHNSDLVPRCDACAGGPGVGNGIGSSIHTSADVDAALGVLTYDHLTFASDVVKVFAYGNGDVKVQVNSVLTIGAGVLAWSGAELAELTTALDAYITGTFSTEVSIFVKATIDVTVFTTSEAAYLKAFVTTCVQSDVQLATEVKADIVLIVKNAIVVANTTCVDLQARIHDKVSALVSVVNSLRLDAKVATGLAAAIIKATLTTLLQVVNAWIANDFGVLTGAAVGLLGIDVKTASDAATCKAIVAFLLNVNAKFNFVSAYGLDAALYAKVFSAVVAH
ncbi:hypothetical protein M407DRAFT_216302 [Tulasnella calospora MUT 4182]|uniref:Uncharacterized protein n=1 Tax=Tulasnella calospora MUT 4182 TaxID=1051891 RepID=A0A0C3Q2B6_9AGAM|nr:hypothetical protein M407DRAFT_216302 [Tulasnella calospora MUT 4182]